MDTARRPAEHVDALDTARLTMAGYAGAEYLLYEDDGVHKNYEAPANRRTLRA